MSQVYLYIVYNIYILRCYVHNIWNCIITSSYFNNTDLYICLDLIGFIYLSGTKTALETRKIKLVNERNHIRSSEYYNANYISLCLKNSDLYINDISWHKNTNHLWFKLVKTREDVIPKIRDDFLFSNYRTTDHVITLFRKFRNCT